MRRTKGLVFVLVLAMLCFGLVAAANAATFSDVTTENAAYTDISKLSSLNIINGYPDGTFKPDGNITRAEFAKIAVVTAGLTTSADFLKDSASQYSDVAVSQWYTGWINVASSQGFVKGYPDGTFKPNANVTAAEAVTVLLRLLGYDDRLPGTWPTDYLAKASKLGITDDISFVASAPATRGLVSQFTSAALEEDLVTYDNDQEDFVWKKDKDDNNISLLADSFDDGILVEEVLVTEVKYDNNGYAMVVYDPDVKKGDVDDTKQDVTFADEVVVAGVPSVFALEGRMVDFILDDDDEVVYVGLNEVKAPVFGKIEDGDYNASKETVEIDGTKYDLNEDFFVCLSKLWDSGPIDSLTEATNDNELEAQGFDTWQDAIEDFKVTLFFNEDNDVVFINKTGPDSAYVVDEVDTKNGEIDTKPVGNLSKETIEDLDADDDDFVIVKNGALINLEDVQEGDVFYDVYNRFSKNGARGFDRYIVVVDSSIKGEFTRYYESNDKGVIGGETYTFADPNGKKGLCLEDADGDAIERDDISDLIGSEVTAKFDANREITYITGDTSGSGNDYGVVVDFGTYSGKGDTEQWIELFVDGEKVTYDIEEDYWDDEENDEIADVFGDFDENDVDDYMGLLIEYGLNSDGEIDFVALPDEDDMVGTHRIGGTAYTVGDAEEDYDRLKVDGTWRYVEDDTIIIDLVYEDGEIDPEEATWKDVEGAGSPVSMDVYYDDDEITYILLWEEGGITDSGIDGVYLDTFKDSDGDLFARFYIEGELVEYEVTTGDNRDLNEGWIYTFDVSDGKVKNLEVADIIFDVVTDVTSKNFTLDDNGIFTVNDETMFIVMDDDDIDEVGDFSDLDEDDEVFVLEGTDEDEGVAEIVVILDDNDLGFEDNDEEPVLEGITLELDPVEVGSSEDDVVYTVTAEYSDGDEVDVTDDAVLDFDKVDFDTVGEYDVTATYEGETVTATLEVVEEGGLDFTAEVNGSYNALWGYINIQCSDSSVVADVEVDGAAATFSERAGNIIRITGLDSDPTSILLILDDGTEYEVR